MNTCMHLQNIKQTVPPDILEIVANLPKEKREYVLNLKQIKKKELEIGLVTNLSDIRERYGAGSKEYHDELLLLKKNNILIPTKMKWRWMT